MGVTHLPSMGQHPLGIRQQVTHACPEHPIDAVPPLCPVCIGTGLVTTERLAAYQREQNRLIAAAG